MVELEIVSVVERALLVEMVVDGSTNGGELLANFTFCGTVAWVLAD